MRTASLLCLVALGACAAPRLYSPYGQLPGTDPDAYEHYIRGRLAVEHGDHELAMAEFRMAAAAESDEPELRVAVGEELLAVNALVEARAEAEAILARFPDAGIAWRLLGRVRGHLADTPGAIQAFEHALTLDATDEDAYLQLATAYNRIDAAAHVLLTYRRLVKSVPTSVEGHYRLGRLLFAVRELPEAERELARALELNSDHIDARVALADVYRASRRADRAQQALRAAFDRSGSDPSVGERLFRSLLEIGDKDSALELLRGLDADWREPNVRLRLGLFFLQLHHADETLRLADAMLARDPAPPAARVLRARALAQLGRRDEAVAACLAVPPGDAYVEARVLAAELYGRMGAPQDGLKVVDEAERVAPDPALVVVKAALLEKLGAIDRARVALDEALQRRPADENLIYARAALEDRTGNPDRAITIMRALSDRNPDNLMALNFIGYSYADRGVSLDVAERLLRRAVELRPDDGYVLDSYGWLMLRRGRLDAAAEALERADRLAPFEPEILFHLGEMWLKKNEPVRAREAFHDALALDPEGKVKDELIARMRTLEAKTRP